MKFLIILCLAAVSVHAQFNAAAQEDIVDGINYYRSRVASGTFHINERTFPAASDMLKVTWNSTLAVAAQKEAEDCEVRYGAGAGMVQAYIVAENEHWVAELVLNYWKKSLSGKWNLKKYDGPRSIGIQLIWAKSSSVGCGFSPCNVHSPGYMWYKVICSFEKKGNILFEPVYKKGKACEACPAGTKCASGSVLCA